MSIDSSSGTFQILPQELLLHQFLPFLENIDIAAFKTTCKTLRLSPVDTTTVLINKIRMRSGSATYKEIKNIRYLIEKDDLSFKRYLQEVRKLDISSSTIEKTILNEDKSSHGLTSLKIQSLKHVRFTLDQCSNITDENLLPILKSSSQLEHLNLEGSNWITDEILLAILRCCPRLKTLNLTGSLKIAGENPSFKTALPHLTLSSLNFFRCPNLTDAGLTAILNHAPHLKKLEISGCAKITCERFNFTHSSIHLNSLKLSNCNNITDLGLYTILKCYPNLTNLNLTECHTVTKNGLIASLNLCLLLTQLNITDCNSATDVSFMAILDFCRHLETLKFSSCKKLMGKEIREGSYPNLTSLELSWRREIDNKDLNAILSLFPNLSSLNLSHLSAITCEGLDKGAIHLLNLKTLELSHCKALTVHGLLWLLSFSPNLSSLNLSGVPVIIDENIEAILSFCSNLTSLNLSGENKIIKETIPSILKKHQTLSEFLYASSITDISIDTIATHCPNLNYIDLNRCPNITYTAILRLFEKCPSLKSVYFKNRTLLAGGDKQVSQRLE